MEESRFILTPMQSKSLPIFIETIGYNPAQEKIDREHGYPHYHWIQSVNGKGLFTIDGQKHTMHQNSGILLPPHVSHTYEALTKNWESVYVTFNGNIVVDMIAHIGLKLHTLYFWEEDNPLRNELIQYVKQAETMHDVFGIQASTRIFQFLLMITNYARSDRNPAINENLEKVQPLIVWMNEQIEDPDIGLTDFAAQLHVSPRNLNALFRETFAASPYAYFIDLRLRRAKQLLVDYKQYTIKEVSSMVGFRSPSHFVATFRKNVGMTPDQFRSLH